MSTISTKLVALPLFPPHTSPVLRLELVADTLRERGLALPD